MRDFTKNRQKPDPPQHMPATCFAFARENFFRLLSPWVLQHLRASNEAACRLATAHQQRCPVSLPSHVSAPPRPHRASSPRPQASDLPNFDVSTFRLFDVSTEKTTQTAQHRNPSPPQALAQFPKPVCHYMSPRFPRALDPLPRDRALPASRRRAKKRGRARRGAPSWFSKKFPAPPQRGRPL
ncbi:hypothetical protein B7486_00890 [cyanobacterium TDX16]|nr:hypothetical protein B7486_00890 [cyanobacterium TDX16]